MGHSRYDAAARGRAAWNAGKTVGTKRPLTQKQIWAIRFFLDRERRVRDRALFDLAIDSKLRGCDLVKIKTGDLVTGPEVRTRATVIQQKTGRPVQFELTSDVRASLLAWLERRGGTVGDHAFPSRNDHSHHMSTRQYARLVDEWVTAIGLRSSDYGTHSLRRTKAAMIYKATGNLRAVQILLGHTKIENTVRYRISVWTLRMLCFWLNGPKSERGTVIRSQRMTASHGWFYVHGIHNWWVAERQVSYDHTGKAALHLVRNVRCFAPDLVVPTRVQQSRKRSFMHVRMRRSRIRRRGRTSRACPSALVWWQSIVVAN